MPESDLILEARQSNRILAALPRASSERLQSVMEPVDMPTRMSLYDIGQPIEHV